MLTLVQTAFCCPCGRRPVKRGLCGTCYALRRRDRTCFGGLRERVLERDGHRCRGCGSHRDLAVHHRRPGVSVLRSMISLCAACHQRVHRVFVMREPFPAALRDLWRELHPGAPEQLRLRFKAPATAAVTLPLPLLWAA